MPPKIVVTGMGIISSIGNSVEANFYALTHKRTGLSVIENLVTAHKNNIRVGEVKLTNIQLAEKLHLPIVNAYFVAGDYCSKGSNSQCKSYS